MNETVKRHNVRLNGTAIQKAAADAAGVSAKVTKIPAHHWDTLKAASNGLEVDILDLNFAIHAAMRTAATRGAQSPSRRELASQCWALAEYVTIALQKSGGPREKVRHPKDYRDEELDGWLDE